MRKMVVFKLTKLQSYVYIVADKIVAVRNFGECVRIYTDSEYFDVDGKLEDVLREVKQ